MSPFFWLDLMTDDVDGSAAFYADLLGWTVTPRGRARVMADAGRAFGAILPLGEDAAAHWIGSVRVPDVDAVLRRLRFVQGEVLLPPEDLGEGKRAAMIADPSGAVLHVVAGAPDDDGAPATPLAVLFAPRPDLGARVHTALFGWTKAAGPALPTGATTLLRDGDATVAWLIPPGPGAPIPPQWLYALRCADPAATAARALDAGAQPLAGPVDLPGLGVIRAMVDPHGAAFALISA